MFRSSENQSIAGASTGSSSHETASSASAANSYPPLDEKNKKVSLREADNDDVFRDEQDESPERFSNLVNTKLIKALSEQAYHLPNYDYWDDWKQYFNNNHPMFGICFHHPAHPIRWKMRAVCFLASIVFGLVITNLVWLWAESLEDNSAVFTVDVGEQAQHGRNVTQYLIDINEANQVEVTTDMIVLWTLGGALHGLFDNTIWTLTICSFCDPGEKYEHLHKYKRFGVGLLSFAVLVVAAIATLSVVLRAAMESEEEVQLNQLRSAGLMDDAVDFQGQNKESYEFLLSYCVELAIALLFHFPVIGFILFSGCLNIKGKLPILGGRPYEVLREEEELAEMNGEVDPETGKPSKRTTDEMTNKERSRLLNSGVRKVDDKEGKISGMAGLWDKKVRGEREDPVGAKPNGTPARAPRTVSFPEKGASNPPAMSVSSRRGSTGSTQAARVVHNPGQYPQRRGSAGSAIPPQQLRGSSAHTNRPAGARGYTGGRIYIPQHYGRGSPGRVAPGRSTPLSSQARPGSRPRGTPASARPPVSPGRGMIPTRPPVRSATTFPHYSAK